MANISKYYLYFILSYEIVIFCKAYIFQYYFYAVQQHTNTSYDEIAYPLVAQDNYNS